MFESKTLLLQCKYNGQTGGLVRARKPVSQTRDIRDRKGDGPICLPSCRRRAYQYLSLVLRTGPPCMYVQEEEETQWLQHHECPNQLAQYFTHFSSYEPPTCWATYMCTLDQYIIMNHKTLVTHFYMIWGSNASLRKWMQQPLISLFLKIEYMGNLLGFQIFNKM
jgi:hypothetical protein